MSGIVPWLAHHAVEAVFAASPPYVPCGEIGLPSCGAANNVLADNLAPFIARVLVNSAVGIALIMILLSGLKLVTNNGDEGKVASARMGVLYSMGGLALALMSQNIYHFVADQDFGDANNALFDVMRNIAALIVTVFNPFFFIFIVFAAIRMVLDRGKEDEYNKAKTTLLWACIGAIVINVAYALVQGILNVFVY